MNWQDILSIVIPLIALMGWVYNRIEKKADERHAQVSTDLKEMRVDLAQIKDRLTRLEGRFDERGYWESRKFTGTDGE